MDKTQKKKMRFVLRSFSGPTLISLQHNPFDVQLVSFSAIIIQKSAARLPTHQLAE